MKFVESATFHLCVAAHRVRADVVQKVALSKKYTREHASVIKSRTISYVNVEIVKKIKFKRFTVLSFSSSCLAMITLVFKEIQFCNKQSSHRIQILVFVRTSLVGSVIY